MHGSIGRGNGQDLLILECFFQCLLNVVNIVVMYLVVYIYISLITTNKCMHLFPYYIIIHFATFQWAVLKLLHFESAVHLFFQSFVKNGCLFVTKIVKLVACQKDKKKLFLPYFSPQAILTEYGHCF